ncbi:MAG TPA: hypothetical protein PK954_21780, partial [Anaerolineales bacterium]|nr:hypothetical protein [Anaerolineales bacterium]
MPIEYIDRPPRVQPELPVAQVPIPAPPSRTGAGGQDIVQMILPLITIVGFVAVSGTGNLLLILPMGGAMLLSVAYSIYQAWRAGQIYKLKEKQYKDTLVELRQDMNRQHNAQRLHYRFNYPDVSTLLDVAGASYPAERKGVKTVPLDGVSL